MIKWTPKEETKTISLLNDTKIKIEEVVAYVNDGRRIAESIQKIVDLQNSLEGNV